MCKQLHCDDAVNASLPSVIDLSVWNRRRDSWDQRLRNLVAGMTMQHHTFTGMALEWWRVPSPADSCGFIEDLLAVTHPRWLPRCTAVSKLTVHGETDVSVMQITGLLKLLPAVTKIELFTECPMGSVVRSLRWHAPLTELVLGVLQWPLAQIPDDTGFISMQDIACLTQLRSLRLESSDDSDCRFAWHVAHLTSLVHLQHLGLSYNADSHCKYTSPLLGLHGLRRHCTALASLCLDGITCRQDDGEAAGNEEGEEDYGLWPSLKEVSTKLDIATHSVVF